ncbi:MAG: hypothetical protein ABJN75_20245 [Hoeflea sp.]|uniref:type II toxin-antitoxin system RelE/ParE family toxin n=1 Tax=Hoeflea sp. TaxID=1940281 RepID=UPI00329A08DB
MKPRDIIFAPEARADVLALYEWISAKANPGVAMAYIDRIERYCSGFGKSQSIPLFILSKIHPVPSREHQILWSQLPPMTASIGIPHPSPRT